MIDHVEIDYNGRHVVADLRSGGATTAPPPYATPPSPWWVITEGGRQVKWLPYDPGESMESLKQGLRQWCDAHPSAR